jgi:hypothetical protein
VAQSIYSLSFDGSGDYVTPGRIAAGSSFTIQAWIKVSSLSGDRGIGHSFAASTPTTGDWWFSVGSSGYISFVVHSSTQYITGNVISAGTWYHIAATYDGSTRRIYVNGVDQGSLSSGGIGGGWDTNTRFGEIYFGAGYQFAGLLDDVAVWNSALSGATIAGLADGSTDPATLSPVGLWRFEEGSGSTANDLGSGANNGTITNATYSADVPSPLSGGGATVHPWWQYATQQVIGGP